MTKLWGDHPLDSRIEEYTVGNDHLLDLRLVVYDCRGSMAHARMLGTIGLLAPQEVDWLVNALTDIAALAEAGNFPIRRSQEDCHTAIEDALVDRLGDTGKKIHTGRSRNDQVLTALRLYTKDAVAEMSLRVGELQAVVRTFANRYQKVPMPGYTHTRKAMPSTVGIWARALVDSLQDDQRLLRAAHRIVDQSPLGTGAGYGVPLPLDRTMTAKELGFDRVQKNPIYAQNSRGKFEATVLHAMGQVLFDLNRVASDLVLFSMPTFGYFNLPEAFCTGSSIMPQKRNPDVLELVRARYHEVLAAEIQLKTSMANMIHGYHRDLQLTKEPFLRALDASLDTVAIMAAVFGNLEVDAEACTMAMTRELFATEEAYKLVVDEGIPFRDAYLRVKKDF